MCPEQFHSECMLMITFALVQEITKSSSTFCLSFPHLSYTEECKCRVNKFSVDGMCRQSQLVLSKKHTDYNQTIILLIV